MSADIGIYWRMVAGRAVPRALCAIGLPPAKIRQRAAPYAAAVTLAIAFGLAQPLVEMGVWVLLVLAGAVFLLLVVFAYEMVAVPVALWNEQAGELVSLTTAARQRQERMQQLLALETLCEIGEQLRAVTCIEEEWCLEVEGLDREIQTVLDKSFPRAAFEYRSMPQRQPAVRSAHRQAGSIEFLDGRLAKLRRIIVREHDEIRNE